MKKWQIQIGLEECAEKEETERYQQILTLLSSIKRHLLLDQKIIQSGLNFDDSETGIFSPSYPKNEKVK